MPKKDHTQLQDAIEILRSKAPITEKAVKDAVLAEMKTRFGCSEKTAYYYYFYKAAKLLKDQGVTVQNIARKAASAGVKKTKKAVTVAEILDSLPSETQSAMKNSSPFASLGV